MINNSMFYTSLTLIQWLLILGVAVVGFMLGRDWSRHKTEDIIEQTIVAMIHQRYIKAKKVDGEYELFEYDADIK